MVVWCGRGDRTEEGLVEQRKYLVEQAGKAGFKVTEAGSAFTLANFADGYEMWLKVEPAKSA